MDDFNITTLRQCTSELCMRLIHILTPVISDGIHSILSESYKLCIENKEPEKYLMTYQNLLSQIPKWNGNIIETETKNIINKTGCNYLEDLITCVHIIQLKTLTSIRVGNKQKKIDISIPKLNDFIHKIYIHLSRKFFKCAYLFKIDVNDLKKQENNHVIENIIHDCILLTIRDSIPIEEILHAYLDENVEIEEEIIVTDNVDGGGATEPETPPPPPGTHLAPASVEEDKKESETPSTPPPSKEHTTDNVPDDPNLKLSIKDVDKEPFVTKLSFNDMDAVLEPNGKEDIVSAPKDIQRLEEISTANFLQRKIDDAADEADEKLVIHNTSLEPLESTDSLLGVQTLDEPLKLDFEEI